MEDLLQWLGLGVASTGEVYIADQYIQHIRVFFTNGNITTLASNDNQRYIGDGGPATDAELRFSNTLAVASTASEIYITMQDNSRIRVVSTSGIINTFAGTGINGYSGDGGAATSAQVNNPIAVAVLSTRKDYIACQYNECFRVVFTNNTIATIADCSAN